MIASSINITPDRSLTLIALTSITFEASIMTKHMDHEDLLGGGAGLHDSIGTNFIKNCSSSGFRKVDAYTENQGKKNHRPANKLKRTAYIQELGTAK